MESLKGHRLCFIALLFFFYPIISSACTFCLSERFETVREKLLVSLVQASHVIAVVLPVICLGFWLYIICSDFLLSKRQDPSESKDLIHEDMF